MTLTFKQKERFLRRRNRDKVILEIIRKEGGIVFGARSVNVQVPKHLQTPTEDFDIFVKGSPKKIAKRIERRLDKKFGGNFFKVKEGQFKGLFKIVSNTSGKSKVDVNKHPRGELKTIKRRGAKFTTLEFQKKKIKESLANPKAKFRRDKDKFSRLRIKLFEQKRKIRKIRRKRAVPRNRLRQGGFSIPGLRI